MGANIDNNDSNYYYLLKRLAGNDMRMTPQRRAILETLRGVDGHPTADEVYDAVRRRMPRISLGTVYRTLELLSRRGMIGKLTFGGAQMRFDGHTGGHAHIRCTSCGKIVDVEIEAETGECERRVAERTGFAVTGRHVEYVGVCRDCRGAEQLEAADVKS